MNQVNLWGYTRMSVVMEKSLRKMFHSRTVLLNGLVAMGILAGCHPDPRHERECILYGTPDDFCKNTAQRDPYTAPLGVESATPPGKVGKGAFETAVMPVFADRPLSENIYASLLLSNYRQILQYLDLFNLLQRPGPITVFAISNKGLEELERSANGALIDQRPLNQARLRRIMAFTIVPGDFSPQVIRALSQENGHRPVELRSLDGDVLYISYTPQGTMRLLNTEGQQVSIIQPGMPQSNGSLYIVDKVLLPSGQPKDRPILEWY